MMDWLNSQHVAKIMKEDTSYASTDDIFFFFYMYNIYTYVKQAFIYPQKINK